MKKIEITLNDELHNKLEETSRKTSKSIEQLIHDWLNQIFEQPETSSTYSPELLAEGYQVMAKENILIAEEGLIAQIMTLENQSDCNHDPNA